MVNKRKHCLVSATHPEGSHMSVPTDSHPTLPGNGRGARLDRALADLLDQAPELEAAAVVSFDGLAMASALPLGMDEDRVAAMSAALLSLGEKAAQGLGRGDLSQVYIEGENGTVFLISAEDEAVLVAVAARGAKAGLMLFEAKRAAAVVGRILADDIPQPVHLDLPVAPIQEVAQLEPILASVSENWPTTASLLSPTPLYSAPPAIVLAPVAGESLPVEQAIPQICQPLPETYVGGPQLVPDLPPELPSYQWSPYAAQPAAIPVSNGWV
jgi:predicted regulator of Ras-like GTPase activity (Roadblock/LC7/MglB family)